MDDIEVPITIKIMFIGSVLLGLVLLDFGS